MISVIMPVYNGEAFLEETIQSVLQQTMPDFEFIIINDGSTDRSEEIILSFKDPRIRYFKQANSGPAAARNKGLDNMKGDFAVMQDADDISLPMRFATLLRHFTSPTVGIVHSDVLLINEYNRPLGYWAAGNIEKKRILRFFLKVGTPFNNNSLMIRREALQGIRQDVSLPLSEDTDMIWQVARHWEAVHVPEPLLLYRRHTTNLTNTKDYHVLFAHVHKFLNSCSLEELIPELNWQAADDAVNRARACAIIALFLLRRGMLPDCLSWYNKAQSLAKQNGELLVDAIGFIIKGDYLQAAQILCQGDAGDPVVLNYLGECLALTGNTKEAQKHFLKALQLKPDYEEPLSNLKGLLGLRRTAFIDRSWTKFHLA
ncbi:glycosyltransferase [Desulforamulus hydrothermalis]|uniref:Glycosyl transferase, family 2 n=1 Tax=Desulforamulus hydrothermalis Lam5 = DSM 18033 TaxID=1121428 RepID=K8DXK4_9FIRM|nr:glycosyltransferase [Desulforamulus hydrothermalis]CCO07382.1 Glycosyl transferase, family 2 [Desulforamulus hydrothermalis Lam5 = DSM 18033]SHH41504.1 Tetratricopeptide repeat-containing protein [Desulforamulus hydrothermalis Lam5 = DSM 18033]